MKHKLLANRRSPRWAFMERFEVPNYDDDTNYLIRWRIVQTPWFGLYLHRFEGPDPRATLHDHPWPFVSIILRGGYIERRLDPRTLEVDDAHEVRWLNRLRTHDAHAIVRLLRVPSWSLLFVGRRVRTWGYWEPTAWLTVEGELSSWQWTAFNVHPHAAEFDRALERRRQLRSVS